jgi:hypothetical protein
MGITEQVNNQPLRLTLGHALEWGVGEGEI